MSKSSECSGEHAKPTKGKPCRSKASFLAFSSVTGLHKTAFRVVVGMILPALPVYGVGAQGLGPGEAPIEVQVQPSIAAPGDTVSIHGSTMVDGRRFDVMITVTPPQGPSIQLAARASQAGEFTATFGSTAAQGTYRVRCVAADGKGFATDSFVVLSYTGMVDRQAAALTDLLQAFDEARAAVTEVVQRTPPSPPQQEVVKQLQDLEGEMRDASAQVDKFRKGMSEIAKVGDQYPIVRPPLREVFDSMNGYAWRMRQLTPKIREVSAAAKKASDLCDDLALALEGLDAMTYAFALSKGGFSLVLDFVLGVGAKKVTDLLLLATNAPLAARSAVTSDVKLRLSAAARVLLQKKPVDLQYWIGKVPSILNNIVKAAGAGLFEFYCEKFVGPVVAHFHADALHEGAPWFKYDIQLNGRIALHYRKQEKPGAPVALTGYVEGNATDIGFWENALALEESQVCGRIMVCLHYAIFSRYWSPFVEEIGALARQLTPRYFLIRVSGQILNGKLSLKLLESRSDFDEYGRIIIIGLSIVPPIPVVSIAKVPFQNARFILEKGMGERPEFPLTMDKEAQVSLIRRTFTREERRGGDLEGVIVQWTIDIKACNPRCP